MRQVGRRAAGKGHRCVCVCNYGHARRKHGKHVLTATFSFNTFGHFSSLARMSFLLTPSSGLDWFALTWTLWVL